ncbi:hypothetical protein PCE1_001041 [Barthelona sp. PCE]
MKYISFVLIFAILLSVSSAVLLECPRAPGAPADRRENMDELIITQFNVQWLFLGGGKHNAECPGSYCDWKSQSQAQRHLTEVAATLDKMPGDIINLVEVEDCDVLIQLLAKMENGHLFRAYLVYGTDSQNGQNVGIITKVDPYVDLTRTENRFTYPIAGNTCGYKGPTKSTGLTQHFGTKFKLQNGKILALYGVHFIAHPDDPVKCVKREAQAMVLKNFIEQDVNYEYVCVLGDFNDYDSTVPDQAGNLAASRASAFLKDSAMGLFSVSEFADKSERWTSWWNKHHDGKDHGGKEHTQIDHILLDNRMRGAVKSVAYDHNHKTGDGYFVSDHWGMWVTLDTSKF